MLTPTTGSVEVLGGAGRATQQAKVGYVAQDTPTYSRLSVADHLQLGARLNPAGTIPLPRQRIQRLRLDPKQRAGKLSGGQRAQLALTLGLAKRPELLILDEPVAALDPLARREFLQDLMEAVAEQELSVVLSSHLVSDVERACDYLIVLVDSRVQVSGEIDTLLATHFRLTGPRRDQKDLPRDQHVVTGEPHRPAVDVPDPDRRADPRPGLDGHPTHARRPGAGLHGPRTSRPRRARFWRCSDDLADLAAVPRPVPGGRLGDRWPPRSSSRSTGPGLLDTTTG